MVRNKMNPKMNPAQVDELGRPASSSIMQAATTMLEHVFTGFSFLFMGQLPTRHHTPSIFSRSQVQATRFPWIEGSSSNSSTTPAPKSPAARFP